MWEITGRPRFVISVTMSSLHNDWYVDHSELINVNLVVGKQRTFGCAMMFMLKNSKNALAAFGSILND